MLDVARRRGAELGLDNVDYHVMDAQELELDDDSVDRILCRFAYMLMPNPRAALAEASFGPEDDSPSLSGERQITTRSSR